jgi:hypothetical protein
MTELGNLLLNLKRDGEYGGNVHLQRMDATNYGLQSIRQNR